MPAYGIADAGHVCSCRVGEEQLGSEEAASRRQNKQTFDFDFDCRQVSAFRTSWDLVRVYMCTPYPLDPGLYIPLKTRHDPRG